MKHTFLIWAVITFVFLSENLAIGQCSDDQVAVEFNITAGYYASEITWQLNDEAGNNIFSGGAPDGATWCLAEGDYTFIGYDHIVTDGTELRRRSSTASPQRSAWSLIMAQSTLWFAVWCTGART